RRFILTREDLGPGGVAQYDCGIRAAVALAQRPHRRARLRMGVAPTPPHTEQHSAERVPERRGKLRRIAGPAFTRVEAGIRVGPHAARVATDAEQDSKRVRLPGAVPP